MASSYSTSSNDVKACLGWWTSDSRDLDTHTRWADGIDRFFFFMLSTWNVPEEKRWKTKLGLKAINKMHSQEGSQRSGLLHPSPRQAPAERHTRRETVSPLTTSASFELGFLPATPLMEEPSFNRNVALYLSVKPGRLISHAGFAATVVAVECNPTLTRNNQPQTEWINSYMITIPLICQFHLAVLSLRSFRVLLSLFSHIRCHSSVFCPVFIS